MLELRPAVAHFSRYGRGRTISVGVALVMALGNALIRSPLAIVIGLAVVASEVGLVLAFNRQYVKVDGDSVHFSGSIRPARSWPRERIAGIVLGRPMLGWMGRPWKVVVHDREGQALFALDPLIWGPAEVERLIAELQVPVSEHPPDPKRSLAGHSVRVIAAALGLVLIVGGVVSAIVIGVLVWH